jgi:L-cysteine desulfidase
MFECKLLNKERNALKQSVLKTNDWPTSTRDLKKKHIKEFMKFTNAIPLDEINAEQNSCKAKCQTVSSRRKHPSK